MARHERNVIKTDFQGLAGPAGTSASGTQLAIGELPPAAQHPAPEPPAPAMPTVPESLAAAVPPVPPTPPRPAQVPLPGLAGPERPRSRTWHVLRWIVIVVGVGLAPLFFADMLFSVADLLKPTLHDWAYVVPGSTEGSFLFLFLIGLLLQMAGKPQAWLRFAPYVFTALSLVMNVWSGHGQPLPSIAHGSVTLAFFLPMIATERAIHSMSVSDQAVRRGGEMKAAMRHASDLVGSYAGWRRWRVPKLLRTQIRHSRPPAAVVAAVHAGADTGAGPVAWEDAVEDWVTRALTRNARLRAKLAAEQQAIAALAVTHAPPGHPHAAMPAAPPVPARGAMPAGPAGQQRVTMPAAPAEPRHRAQPAAQQVPSMGRARDSRDTVRQIIQDHPGWTNREVASMAGVHPSTVSRVRNARPLASGE